MEWSLEKTIILAETVQKFPLLYDGVATYNNTAQIHKTCENVAEIVGNGATGFFCKKRWQALRHTYRNHVKYGYRVSPAGIEPYLQFMAPYLRTKAELAAKCAPEDSLEYCIKLTQIVKDYPQIYLDMRHSENSDDWQEVATRMGTKETPEKCALHWNWLRSRYFYHLKRGFKMKPSGIEEHLAFLDKLMDVREETSIKSTKRNSNVSLEYCVKLTQIVKEYPHLLFVIRSTSNSEDWQDVAIRMGTGDTPDQCMVHWSRLRSRYSCHLKRGIKMQPQGIEQHMAFLAPLMAARGETSLESSMKLVNLVREYPVLYGNEDSNNQLSVWKKVAERMGNGATAHECEAYWRSLRNSYENSLQKGSEIQRIGIEDHMEFLKPYLSLTIVEPTPRPKKIRLDLEAKMETLRRDTAVAAVLSHKHLKFGQEDEDLLFLFEFLQDMAKMDDDDKLSFKLGAMKLAEKFRSP